MIWWMVSGSARSCDSDKRQEIYGVTTYTIDNCQTRFWCSVSFIILVWEDCLFPTSCYLLLSGGSAVLEDQILFAGFCVEAFGLVSIFVSSCFSKKFEDGMIIFCRLIQVRSCIFWLVLTGLFYEKKQ